MFTFRRTLSSILSNLTATLAALEAHAVESRKKSEALTAKSEAAFAAAADKQLTDVAVADTKLQAAREVAYAKYDKALDKAEAARFAREESAASLAHKADVALWDAQKAERVAAKVKALVS
jgi:hypothetical protein